MSGSALKFPEFDVDPTNLRGTFLTSTSSSSTRFSALLNPVVSTPVGDAIMDPDMILDDMHRSAAYTSVQQDLKYQYEKVSVVDKEDEEIQAMSLRIDSVIIGGRDNSVDCGVNPLKQRWLFLQYIPDRWKIGSNAMYDFEDLPDNGKDNDVVANAAANVKKSVEVSLRDQIVRTLKVLTELVPLDDEKRGSDTKNPVHKNDSFPELRFVNDMINSLIARKYVYSESKKKILDNDRLRERIECFHHGVPIVTLQVVRGRFLFIAVRNLVYRCEEAIYNCMNITESGRHQLTHTAAIARIDKWLEECLPAHGLAQSNNTSPFPRFSLSYKDSSCETKWLHFLTRLKLFTVKDCAYLITQAFVELLALPCQDAIDICATSYLSDMYNRLRPEKPAEQSKKQKQRLKIYSLRAGRFEDLSVVTQANFIYYALCDAFYKESDDRVRSMDDLHKADERVMFQRVLRALHAVNITDLDGRRYTEIVDKKDKKNKAKAKDKAKEKTSLPIFEATEEDIKLAGVVTGAVEAVSADKRVIGVKDAKQAKNQAELAIHLSRTSWKTSSGITLYELVASAYEGWRRTDNSLERVIAAEYELDPEKREEASQKWLGNVANSDVWVACSHESLLRSIIAVNEKNVEPGQMATEEKHKKRSLTKLNVFQKAVTDYQQPVAQIAAVLKLAFTYNRYAHMDHEYVMQQAAEAAFDGEKLTDRIGHVSRMRYCHDDGMNPHFKTPSWKPVADLMEASSWFPIPFGRNTDKTFPVEEMRNGMFVARCVEIIRAIQHSLDSGQAVHGCRAKRRQLILLDVLTRLHDSPITQFYDQYKSVEAVKKAETYDLLLYKNSQLALCANTSTSGNQVKLTAVIDSHHTQKTTAIAVLGVIGDLNALVDDVPMSHIPLTVYGTSYGIYRMTRLASCSVFKSVHDDFQSRVMALSLSDRRRQERRLSAAVSSFLDYVGESTNGVFDADYGDRFGIAVVASCLVLYRTMSRVCKDLSDAEQSTDAKTKKRKCHALESEDIPDQDITGPFMNDSHATQLVFKIGLVPNAGWDVIRREVFHMLNRWHPTFRTHCDARQITTATSALIEIIGSGCPTLSQLGVRQRPLSVRTMIEAWEAAHQRKHRRC